MRVIHCFWLQVLHVHESRPLFKVKTMVLAKCTYGWISMFLTIFVGHMKAGARQPAAGLPHGIHPWSSCAGIPQRSCVDGAIELSVRIQDAHVLRTFEIVRDCCTTLGVNLTIQGIGLCGPGDGSIVLSVTLKTARSDSSCLPLLMFYFME